MNKIFLLLVLVLGSLSAFAEPKEDNVIKGDLNKDGFEDKVVVSYPRDPEKISVREDGYEYDFNRPILRIYFGDANGKYKLFKQYKELLPYSDNEFLFVEDLTVEVSPKGILSISYGTFASAGSYGVPHLKYVYRFQNGDFFLIGSDQEEFSRSSGKKVVVSENYLSWKKQTITSNEFDENVKPAEKWERIPKKPLSRLGDSEL